jgi:hypothetical protein
VGDEWLRRFCKKGSGVGGEVGAKRGGSWSDVQRQNELKRSGVQVTENECEEG